MAISTATKVMIGAACGMMTVSIHHGIMRFARRNAAKASLALLKELDRTLELARVGEIELKDYQEFAENEIRIAISTNMTWGDEVLPIRRALSAFNTDILASIAKEGK